MRGIASITVVDSLIELDLGSSTLEDAIHMYHDSIAPTMNQLGIEIRHAVACLKSSCSLYLFVQGSSNRDLSQRYEPHIPPGVEARFYPCAFPAKDGDRALSADRPNNAAKERSERPTTDQPYLVATADGRAHVELPRYVDYPESESRIEWDGTHLGIHVKASRMPTTRTAPSRISRGPTFELPFELSITIEKFGQSS